jgi:signal transduction histidine kinase
MSLFWRVFFVNAALLIAGVLVLALTPISVSAQIRLIQALVLAVGVVIVLVANLILLRPLFAPLERLARRMEELDVLRALQPVSADSPGEIGALERAFNRMIERLEAERRQAGTRALQAREEERQRIARGLHDEVGQTMTGVLFLLKQLAQDAPDSQRVPLDEAQQAIRTNLDEVRRIAQELRPEALDHLGLPERRQQPRARLRATDERHGRTTHRPATSPATVAASSCASPTTAAGSTTRTSRAAGCAASARTHSSPEERSRSSRARPVGSRSGSKFALRAAAKCRSRSSPACSSPTTTRWCAKA